VGRDARQRWSYRVLYLAVRRVSVRAVPGGERERAQRKFINIWRHSPQLAEVAPSPRGPSTADCGKSFARTGIPSANMLFIQNVDGGPPGSRLVHIQIPA
jgi:hypothetical protein